MDSQLLTPDNHTLMLVDHEGQMALAVGSHPLELVLNATAGLAKTAALFAVPTIVTTVSERSFSGPLFPAIRAVFPDEQDRIDRTTMNPWEDAAVRERFESIGRRKVVIAGLWTEVCVALPVIHAIEDGYEAYVVADACGGVSAEAHERAVQRMVQAGARPLTWMQYLLELQRDWARHETSGRVGEIAREHGGAYGVGIEYIYTMLDWDRAAR
jgi:nicotinamidase-related amidase